MNRKIALFTTLLLAGGALTWIAVGNMGNNLVYYWSPAEMKTHGSEAVGATIRLGGQVVAGSIKAGNPLRFQLSDGSATVDVSTTEIPPQMFREGIGVVVEGIEVQKRIARMPADVQSGRPESPVIMQKITIFRNAK
jgi:cytochrome c-type biogenesis protein CcmE